MFRPTSFARNGARRGVILLVVLALLTLFALVGISFVLYADAQALSARTFREAESQPRADMDPYQLFAYAMGQIVYDVRDREDPSGLGQGMDIYSSIRGHSLGR